MYSVLIHFSRFFIATAVHEGKPCFLDQEEWQTFAAKVRNEDCKKPGEWSAYAELIDLAYMEITKCPRYISETRELLASPTDPDPNVVFDLLHRIQITSNLLYQHIANLRACITAHNERRQGIIQDPGSFIGPVPAALPDTGPSLLLSGAANMQEMLQQLRERLEDQLRFSAVDDQSPCSISTPSDNGTYSATSSPASTRSHPPPALRIHSELEHGPAQETQDPHAPSWLDRLASSMGVLGAKVLPTEETVESDSLRPSSEPL